ncbi:uncharacterized protein CC84DRAFT_1021129 [Paraphaeosphaeria sporulosa]|uniref:Uncharacterized protein n=1 Tax=Paraphaeosphaeria sporulosa TaxID=1460663 RepID=A0A177C3X6_9PLEO|nr:uncharacterized protein CC84DRAFT_1021129 [Paraphaeosphaeria sporulosa]OAG02444.1 hypothetical protein CC84DRAFT_1021129 [Paraphaeosphaeria sporulosa]
MATAPSSGTTCYDTLRFSPPSPLSYSIQLFFCHTFATLLYPALLVAHLRYRSFDCRCYDVFPTELSQLSLAGHDTSVDSEWYSGLFTRTAFVVGFLQQLQSIVTHA